MQTKALEASFSAPAIESLASRYRSAGLCLLVLDESGRIVYFDGQAPTFFQRYALPLIRYRDQEQALGNVTWPTFAADGNVSCFEPFPGGLMANCSITTRKSQVWHLALMAKSMLFSLGKETQTLCNRLGMDGDWLAQQAGAVPSFIATQLQREMQMLITMARDQMRIGEVQSEVETLSNQLANTYEELSLIYQLSSGMRVNRSAQDFFKQVCLDVMGVMGVSGMGAVLRSSSLSRDPVLYGSISLPPGYVHRVANELMEHLKNRPMPLVINRLADNADFGWLSDSAERMVAVPVMRDEQVLGCFFAFDKISGEFDTVDTKLLNSIANESGIYLENASLFEDVRSLMMGILHSLTSAVDAKDPYTCGHSERVAMMARELAMAAGLPPATVDRVYMSGLLHDVGKIGVPEAVLQKPGKLTDEEFTLIKQHPDIGAKILRDVKQMEDVIPGVLYHHERWDGKGYPQNLSGEDIPLFGRIICLADCFDAMTSSRTYRRALPFEVAMTEIQKGAGTQFDPVLAQTFIKIGETRLRELIAAHSQETGKIIEMSTQRRVA